MLSIWMCIKIFYHVIIPVIMIIFILLYFCYVFIILKKIFFYSVFRSHFISIHTCEILEIFSIRLIIFISKNLFSLAWQTSVGQLIHFEVERATDTALLLIHSLFNMSTQSFTSSCYWYIYIYTSNAPVSRSLFNSLWCFKLKLIIVCLH